MLAFLARMHLGVRHLGLVFSGARCCDERGIDRSARAEQQTALLYQAVGCGQDLVGQLVTWTWGFAFGLIQSNEFDQRSQESTHSICPINSSLRILLTLRFRSRLVRFMGEKDAMARLMLARLRGRFSA